MPIQIFSDGQDIPVKHIQFSDGGSNILVTPPAGFKPERHVVISVDPITPVDAVVQQVINAFEACVELWDDFTDVTLQLHLPYLPHGRADRRFEPGNAFPLMTMCESLFTIFDVVYLTDPHSNYVQDHMPEGVQLQVKSQTDCFLELNIPIDATMILVSPDEGARDKTQTLAERLGVSWVSAWKTRNPENGRVISTELPNADYDGKRCVIVDDICDGGGTFIPLAAQLRDRGAKSVELYVTHGIFAKGLEPFTSLIDKLHVYQIVANYVTRSDIANFNRLPAQEIQ
jgi:ribose-phosphate pyrophosphokinase